MTTSTALFYVFSVVLLFAAFRVITARSPVYAALFLVLAFFSAACVWILLRAEFLAIALVLVYVGAVMVLFLFVVMMLDVDTASLRVGFWKHFPVALLVGVVIALEMAAVLMPGFSSPRRRPLIGGGAQARQHQAARHRGLHQLPLSAADRRGAPAGGDHRRDLADAARAQGPEAHRPVGAGQGEEGRPGADGVDEARGGPRCRRQRCRRAGGRIGDDLGPVTLGHYLTLGAILFALSVIGIFLNRKNLIVLLMAIELMLLAVNLNFVAFSYYLGDMAGQVFVFFILTVAAAESAIGLAILVVLFRTRVDDRRRRARHAEGLSDMTAARLSPGLLARRAAGAAGRRRSSPACSAGRSAAAARTRSPSSAWRSRSRSRPGCSTQWRSTAPASTPRSTSGWRGGDGRAA